MQRPYVILFTACLITGCLGSVHAFSVFIEPLEQALVAGRGRISLIYSGALICLTVAVLLGHRVYSRISPAALMATVCMVAAVGLSLAAVGRSFLVLIVGYSLLFGAANGLGYGYSLMLVSHALPRRKGLAMGTVTAVYAVGATLFAKIYQTLIQLYGYGGALGIMGLIMCALAVVTGVLLFSVKIPGGDDAAAGAEASGQHRLLVVLWLGYGLGVAAGLMAIGHAAGIVAGVTPLAGIVILGVMLIGVGNALGGFAAGWLADRVRINRLLIGLPLLSAAALVSLVFVTGATATVTALTVVGLAYGMIIAVYPAATTFYFGLAQSPKVYGRIFTAWGLAGLAGPWLGGIIFDAHGQYGPALVIAAAAAVCSAAACLALPGEPPPAPGRR